MERLTIKLGRVFPFSLLSLLMIMVFFNGETQAQDETKILDKWLQYTDASNVLYHHLSSEAYKLLDLREEKVSRLNTVTQWQERQKKIPQILWKILGPFPKKTPLHAQITGKIKKEGYTIENIVYESLPHFYVTASLFIPDKLKGRAPAILFCSGHTPEAYRNHSYLLPLLNLVKKGFIVLAFDPIGQGERLQYFNSERGTSLFGGPTQEHSYPSVQVFLLGQSVARYFIWDGIRAIDYLVSRKEVDPERIGVHGLSGGGTQTAYLSALDDRVVAAAPACYITSFSRLLESIGPQDGEQNFYHGILNEIDHADFLELRAPKPTLVMATTRDFFSIQGTRETYAEVKRIYDIFGKSSNFEMVEDDYEHGYTKKNREAMYTFFQKHLNNPGSPKEEDVEYPTEKELKITSTGQLATSLEGEIIFSLNCKEAETYDKELTKKRKDLRNHLQKIPMLAQRLSGYKTPLFSDKPVFTGRIQQEGYVMEKYFVKGEGNYVLPYLLLKPQQTNGKAIIYLHPKGKEVIEDKEEKDEIAWLMGNNFTVLVPDLPGIGELGRGALRGDAYIGNVSYNLLYCAMLSGRSIVGVQASDVVKLAHLLKQNYGAEEVYGIAREEVSPVLLHAAVFDSTISRVSLIRPYSSYCSFVRNRFYESRYVSSLVPGALSAYDLPDLAANLAPSKLLIVDMVNCNGERDDEEIQKDLKVIREAYDLKHADDQLILSSGDNSEILYDLYKKWID